MDNKERLEELYKLLDEMSTHNPLMDELLAEVAMLESFHVVGDEDEDA